MSRGDLDKNLTRAAGLMSLVAADLDDHKSKHATEAEKIAGQISRLKQAIEDEAYGT